MKLLLFILLIMVPVLCAGCSDLKVGHGLESIALDCFESPSLSNSDCKDKFYDDDKTLKKFREAIEKANRIPGALDYQPEYTMTLTYRNSNQSVFYFSLTSNRDYNGLVVEQSNSEKGYSIPKDKANELRDIVYR
ncbi:hypothetical protein [Paenibacillus physcomitrellae]|nr:hypothetical protein [Paenibacillus physcomitrellae]